MFNIKKNILETLRGYKKVFSPLWSSLALIFPVACKFYPTCSEYSHQAVEKYGWGKGFWLSFKRIIRCHPFNNGGLDMIP